MDARALRPGYELRSFSVESVLGRGGFGITYLASHRYLPDKRVAIKEFFPEFAAVRNGTSAVHIEPKTQREYFQWGLNRFLEEARLLQQFEHPSIVRVQDFFEENNTAYMVMDYVEGHSIQQIVERQGPLSETVLRGLVRPLFEALELLHKKGLLHRDISPENIVVDEHNSPVLIDFGSARYAKQTHTVVAKEGYAPIEQYEQTDQGPYTDIYGLGATLYFAAFATVPPDSKVRSGGLRQHKADLLEAAQELGGGRFSEDFLRAIDVALALEPTDRPQNVQEWLSKFREPPLPAPPDGQGANARSVRRILLWFAGGILAIVILTIALFEPPPLDDVLSEASNKLTAGPQNQETLLAARKLYFKALKIDAVNPTAEAGLLAISALLGFSNALDNIVLDDPQPSFAEAELQIGAAREALQKAGIDPEILHDVEQRLQLSKSALEIGRVIERNPLSAEMLTDAENLLRDARDHDVPPALLVPSSEALASLREARKALGSENYGAAFGHINDAEEALDALGISRLMLARVEVAKQREQKIDRLLAQAAAKIQRAQLTEKELTDAELLYQQIEQLAPGHPAARAGVEVVVLLRAVDAEIAGREFSRARRTVEEMRSKLGPARLDVAVAERPQQRITKTEIDWRLEEAKTALGAGSMAALEIDAARAHYRAILLLQPAHSEAIAGIEMLEKLDEARKAHARNDFDAALGALAEAKQAFASVGNDMAWPDTLEAQILADWERLKTGQFDRLLIRFAVTIEHGALQEQALTEARRLLVRAAELKPDEKRVESGLKALEALDAARVTLTTQDFDAARGHIEEAERWLKTLRIEELPKARTAVEIEDLLQAAQTASNRNEFTEARAALNQARTKLKVLAQDEAQVDRLEERLTRREIEWHLAKAEEALRSGAFSTQAIGQSDTHYRAVLSLQPDHAKATAATKAIDLLQEVQEARDRGEYALALSALGQAIELLREAGINTAPLEAIRVRLTDAQNPPHTGPVERLLIRASVVLEYGGLDEQSSSEARQLFERAAELQPGETRIERGLRALGMLETARAALAAGKYERALTYVEYAEQELEPLEISSLTLAREEIASEVGNR